MKIISLVLFVLSLCLFAGCGDGPDEASPTLAPRPKTLPTVQINPSQAVAPCTDVELSQTKPNLPYTINITQKDSGMTSFNGVLIMACMGQPDPGKKAATEKLGEGIQAWLEKEYPKGSTETGQAAFETKVCKEIARLMSQDQQLAKINWVLLATNGTFTLPVYGIGTPLPTQKPQGKYLDPTCQLPKPGPVA